MASDIRYAVIDDDPDWLHLVRRALRLSDPELAPVEFSDAEEALGYLRDHPVDLIITDFRMPGMDGLSFIREFREKNRHTPVVLVSSEYLRDDALAQGANAFVRKGDLNRTLIPTVHELMQRARERTIEALSGRGDGTGESAA